VYSSHRFFRVDAMISGVFVVSFCARMVLVIFGVGDFAGVRIIRGVFVVGFCARMVLVIFGVGDFAGSRSIRRVFVVSFCARINLVIFGVRNFAGICIIHGVFVVSFCARIVIFGVRNFAGIRGILVRTRADVVMAALQAIFGFVRFRARFEIIVGRGGGGGDRFEIIVISGSGGCGGRFGTVAVIVVVNVVVNVVFDIFGGFRRGLPVVFVGRFALLDFRFEAIQDPFFINNQSS